MIAEEGKFKDAQGFRCTAWLCPECSNRIGTRDLVTRPPCRQCGFVDAQPAKDGVEDYQPGVGAVTDGRAFMQMMKGKSVPGAG